MRLAVAGGKGGVGTSTVAYNLGAELDAVVVDADLAMADLPTSRGPDLQDVLAGRADPVEAVREGGPVALLPCGRSLAGARAADPTALAGAVAAVEDAYGAAVLDAPAGRGPGTGLALQAAGACVIVTTPVPVAIADAARARSLARQLDTGLVCAVVNRTGPDPPVEAAEVVLGAPAVAIPESPAAAGAMTHGLPARAIAADAPAAERFQEIARQVQLSRRS